LVSEGRAAAAYDWPTHHAAEQAVFGVDTPYDGWHYPPVFLAIAVLLAQLPYIPALLLWQASTFTAYLASLRLLLASGRGGSSPARPSPPSSSISATGRMGSSPRRFSPGGSHC
jgi:hypothetical protein